ncbi:auxin response factor 3a [Hordeum vulgare]|nr:auxin response factor 3a [Hordeum vulgare]
MRIHRQRRILKQRLKVPPTLHQFTRTLYKNLGTQDYNQQRPSQELVAKDLHVTEWKFRHIYRAMALNPYIWDFE